MRKGDSAIRMKDTDNCQAISYHAFNFHGSDQSGQQTANLAITTAPDISSASRISVVPSACHSGLLVKLELLTCRIRMRILTWNINGVRTLPQYHPWNTLKTFDDILNRLEGDIICFQEMKSSRQALPKGVALPPSFDSFFSFPVNKSGYSGVATYVRHSSVLTIKAEEGLTGCIQPKPSFRPDERISRPALYPPDFADAVDEPEEVDYRNLDSEGRALVIDLGFFVLVNTYCPNDGTGTEERARFKIQYHRLLEKRVRDLIAEGREVIVVGDLNACAAVEDHCEGRLMVERGLAEGLEGEEGFWGKDYRRWIRDLILGNSHSGCMVDIVRKFWPDRKGLYTCWNTKISARETNYGTRIDFILVTPGLVPWIKAADIQPHIKGSDHCPAYVDFLDELIHEDGSIVRLADVLGARVVEGSSPPELPRIAAKHWDEHKQKLLSTFFGKKDDAGTPPSSSTAASSTSKGSAPIEVPAQDDDPDVVEIPSIASSNAQDPPISTTPSISATADKRKAPPDLSNLASISSKKVKRQTPRRDSTRGKGKPKVGQSTLASFISQTKPVSAPMISRGQSSPTQSIPNDLVSSSSQPRSEDEQDLDADYQFALLLSQSEGTQSPPSSQNSSLSGSNAQIKGKSKQAWTSLLAPTEIPRCTVHGEPAKEYTVNKQGPNKGKRFFICSRPVGVGYDKGRSERPREQVDPQYRCNYFKWSSEVRKEMLKKS